jgi:hypothetical protein
VAEYGCADNSKDRFGFCDAHSKTDNFKVRTSKPVADITVCKFNDFDGDGTRDADEPLIQHWPITATGVDGGTVNAQTADDGCVSFTYSGFADSSATQIVTLSEGTFGPDWLQTAPADDADATDGISVSGGVITLVVKPGDSVVAPYFGNHNEFCDDGDCNLNELLVTKTAFPSLKRTFTWDIEKSVEETEIDASAGSTVTFNYTVNVTHDSGTDSEWAVAGKITVSNPGGGDITGVDVTDAVDNGGSCSVTGGAGVTIAGGSHEVYDYTCTYSALPADGINTATATAEIGGFSGTASVDFDLATIATVDDVVSVNDSLGGDLGTVKATDPSPTTFTYSIDFTAPSGTCKSYDNTATFTTNSTGTTDSASQTVKVCGALDPTVSKTASADFSSDITKAVNKTLVEQQGGSYTFNYTVTVTTSGWIVSGAITVTNLNDWESISGSVLDSLSDAGGACTVDNAGAFNVAASSSAVLNYSCSFASAPTANSGTNTASASWDGAAAHTVNSSASGTAGYDFGSANVVDTFNGTATTLGSVNGNEASKTFTYSHTVQNGVGGTCTKYDNTATFRGESASQSVNICNQATGDSTIGFWNNRNGQNIIKAANQADLKAFLMQYAPFQDIGTTAIATYVSNVVKAATAGSATLNAMLKGQMLGTALNVYFSDPAHNALGAPTPLGTVKIDLTMVCTDLTCTAYEDSSSVFGGSPKTVAEMLTLAAVNSNVGGSTWYANVKSTQELAKDAFDVINNQLAWIAP